jgi:2-dehydro-3-deoxygluconokinase
MKMKQIVCFGEIMLRLNPEGYLRFKQARRFEASYAGGEANVAVSLANYDMNACYVTRLPDNDLGASAMNALRAVGVDTSRIVFGGERLGIYFVEKGASQRPSKVIYDRKHSAISTAVKSDFDWERIFEDAEWFHFTGITPALGDNVAEICREACEKAKEKGLTVSCDLNFRKNLWSREKAGEVMGGLMPFVDLCIANEEDAEMVFGIKPDHNDIIGGKLSREGYTKVASGLADRFGCKKVAITLRESLSASDNNWAGLLYDGKEFFFSRNYPVHIVDRVGGGDSFGGGLIYALMNGYGPAGAIEFAVAASCLKHSIEFDFNCVTVEEVLRLMKGDASGRVQR